MRRDWRLNERHYGDLQGKNKAQIKQEFGEEQFMLWRRSYDTPPPPLAADNPYDVTGDPRYEDLEREVPRTECLADVVRRDVPYWERLSCPTSAPWPRGWGGPRGGARQLHPRPAQAPRGHSDDAITGLEIPTGIPYRMLLDDDLTSARPTTSATPTPPRPRPPPSPARATVPRLNSASAEAPRPVVRAVTRRPSRVFPWLRSPAVDAPRDPHRPARPTPLA